MHLTSPPPQINTISFLLCMKAYVVYVSGCLQAIICGRLVDISSQPRNVRKMWSQPVRRRHQKIRG